MSRFMKIDGIIEVPDDVDHDQFWHELIKFVESKGYCFNGLTDDITDEDDDE